MCVDVETVRFKDGVSCLKEFLLTMKKYSIITNVRGESKCFESQHKYDVTILRHFITTTVQTLKNTFKNFGHFERLVDVWQ